MGGLGGLLHHLGLKVWVVNVWPDLGDDLGRDVVLVVCLKLLQKACSSKPPGQGCNTYFEAVLTPSATLGVLATPCNKSDSRE